MSQALERPNYLNKLPDVKVWEVHVEKGYEVSINRFTDLKQAQQFAKERNIYFDPKDFEWVKQAELATLRGLRK